MAGRPFRWRRKGIIFPSLYDGATADGRCNGSDCYIDGGGTVVTVRANRYDARTIREDGKIGTTICRHAVVVTANS